MPDGHTHGGRRSCDLHALAIHDGVLRDRAYSDARYAACREGTFLITVVCLVPELGPDTALRLADRKPLDEFSEALDAGVRTRPVLLGPVTFLLLAKPAPGFSTLELLEPLVEVYAQLLAELGRLGAGWVQLDEPALVADRTDAELERLAWTYRRLGAVPGRPKMLVAGYYGNLGPALPVLAASPVEAIGLDLVAGIEDLRAAASLPALQDKTVLAGVVDGRNVWRTGLDATLGRAATLLGTAGRVEVSTSCPLLHVPYDVGVETALAPALRNRLAFAEQKVAEVVLLGRALREGRAAVAGQFAAAAALRTGVDRPGERDHRVRARLDSPGAGHYRRGTAAERAAAQRARLRLGPVPTTPIGSFPQTGQIRADRAAHRAGRLDDAEYERRMRAEIERVIRLQEQLGLDVLVHGEPERNDMVQYFAEHLDGFATTEFGWCSPTAPGACARRCSTPTCPARRRSPSGGALTRSRSPTARSRRC